MEEKTSITPKKNQQKHNNSSCNKNTETLKKSRKKPKKIKHKK
jgi:hypothetical protein